MDSRGGTGAPAERSTAAVVEDGLAELRARPVLLDGLLVAVVGGPLVLAGAFVAGDGGGAALPALVVGAGMVLPLAWRRVAPLAVLATLCVVGAVQLLVLGLATPVLADAAFAVALYTVTGRARTPVTRWIALPVGVGAALLCAVAWSGSALVPAFLVLVVLVAFVTGTLRRVRSAYVEGLVERADGAELERDHQLHLAESAERARIAREMHDVVAHSLSVIIVQADGGSYAARQDPARAVEVLATIATTGREALTQMRQLLGVLREDPAVGPSVPTTPQPGLAELPALVDRIAATGLPVHADLAGTVHAEDVPQATGLVGYRVVQESLTNVLKHAGRVGRVDVTVERVGDRLRIEVSDDGRGAAAALGGSVPSAPAPGVGDTTVVVAGPGPVGQGLRGMRERVALLGGRLVAGPRPGGGFRTVATLPAPAREGTTSFVPGWVPPTGRPRPAPIPVAARHGAHTRGAETPRAETPRGAETGSPLVAPAGSDAWRTWDQERSSRGRRGRRDRP